MLRSRLDLFLALLALALAIACSGDDDEDPTPSASPTVAGTIVTAATPSPTATLGTAPEVTPTPTPLGSAEEQAENLRLIEAPQGLLQWVTDGPYVVPGDALGVFYLDIETQQIEGWYDLIGDTSPAAFSGDNRFTLFERSEQVFRGSQTYPAGYYLGDREAQKVYRWDGDARLVNEKAAFNGNEVASRGELVLFRIFEEDDDDWFILFDVAANEAPSVFQAEGRWALISADARRIALIGDSVSIVDVDSGEVERVADGVFDDLAGADLENSEPGKAPDVELIESIDRTSFLVAINSDGGGAWQRYEWDGHLVAGGQGLNVFVSPDGEYVAAAEPMPADATGAFVHTYNAWRTSDASPVFRVVGVDERFAWSEHDRWLADGFGLVIELADGTLQLAMRDGEIRDYLGVPSPTSPEVFAVRSGGGTTGTVGAVDQNGEPIVVVSFQGGVRDFVDPWGDTGEEVRMLLPHGGHDGPPLTASIVKPYVEQAPYNGPPQLQLSQVAVGFGLVNLYDEPGGANVVGQVGAPYRVTVQEVAQRCHGNGYSDPQDCPKSESDVATTFIALVLGAEIGPDFGMTSYWARVTTPDGQSGWLLLQANVQGI